MCKGLLRNEPVFTVCGKQLWQMWFLSRHMIIHDYTQILKCQKRGANYLEKAHYENHMKMGNKNQN